MVNTSDRESTAPNASSRSTKGPLKWIVGFGAVAIVGAAIVGALLLGLFSAEPGEVNLQETAAAVAEESGTVPSTEPSEVEPTETESSASAEETNEAGDTNTDNSAADPASAEASVSSVDDLTGVWMVTASDSTFVGYRADSLAGLAVGRSPGVEGDVVFDGGSVTDVSITADLSGLTSDSSVRDSHLAEEGLETDTFPTSTFVLTEPIELGQLPAEGLAAEFSITGDLTVKEVTRSVTLDLEGTVVGDRLVIVGSTPIVLADFNATIGNNTDAEMEFSLVLAR